MRIRHDFSDGPARRRDLSLPAAQLALPQDEPPAAVSHRRPDAQDGPPGDVHRHPDAAAVSDGKPDAVDATAAEAEAGTNYPR